MRVNGKIYLVLGTFCLIFCVAGDYEAAAFEKQNESVSVASDSTKSVDTVDHLKTSNPLKSVEQPRQSITEAKELADLSILMEKALNSQPAAGQNNAYGNRYSK
jgi:hypothetical protein